MKSATLRLRIEPELKQSLQTAIQNGQAPSMSELIRMAVKEHLSKLEPT